MSTYSNPIAGAPLAKLGAMLRGGSVIQIVDAMWVPTVAALLVIAAGLAGHWMKQPWLFAGIGPTAFMIANAPGQEQARFRNVVVGHLAAIGCAYLALLILNASGAPSVLVAAKVSLPRVWASALALGMLALVQPQLKSYHPPAAATLLLITLGAYRMTGRTPLALMAGVVLVAVMGELLNKLRPRGR